MSDTPETKPKKTTPAETQSSQDIRKEPEKTGDKNASFLPVAKTPQPPPKRRWVKPVLLGVLALALLFGIPWGINYWNYSHTHVSTDDAYVTGNLVSVSPVVNGTLQQLLVDEGVHVRKGQLIARLDNAGPQSNLRQARANYQAALTQIPQAERNLRYQQQATEAAIRKAEAALQAQQAKASGAQQQVTLASGTSRNEVRQAQSQVQVARLQQAQAEAQARSAERNVENFEQAVQTALASQENYQQQVQTAQKAVQTAQARVQSAQTELDRAAKDEERYRVLYQQDAVSAQVYDNARAQARSARANQEAAQSQVEQAQSQVEQAKASVKQAVSQVEQARKSVTQAQSQARAAHRAADTSKEQVQVAQAGLGLAQAGSAQVGVQRANLLSTTSATGEAEADIANAQAGREQIEARRRQIETYRAQAQQAQAALTNAQIVLNDAAIYAPSDGTIVRKTANVGVSLAPGQSIVTMTQGDYVWVQANFKETQLRDVHPGQEAEIEVDAVPGKVFKGRVRSINEATGAATSLLPPENATGNFTKVVQRIPVRIELTPARDSDDKKLARAEDIVSLRQGMSVNATIDISSKPDNTPEATLTNAGQGSESSGTSTPGGTGSAPSFSSGDNSINTPNGGNASGNTSSGNNSNTNSSGSNINNLGKANASSDSTDPSNAPSGANSGPNNAIPNPGTGPLLQDGPNSNNANPGSNLNNGPGAGRPNRTNNSTTPGAQPSGNATNGNTGAAPGTGNGAGGNTGTGGTGAGGGQ